MDLFWSVSKIHSIQLLKKKVQKQSWTKQVPLQPTSGNKDVGINHLWAITQP